MPSIESAVSARPWVASRPEGWVLDGWVTIVAALLDELGDLLVDHPAVRIRIEDAKDKFGTLRLRCWPVGQAVTQDLRLAVQDAVCRAEIRSATTCDVCGAPGRLRENDFGRLATKCDLHAADFCREPDGQAAGRIE